ncbi:histidine decarboxylase [Nakamurella sp. UYEF19]|uniref:histidine decarboxylase, pyruvoyl type n=1 Tax=Nakamurella sp. UYEF19 TaxID=1756392 RepID=UPI003398DBFC
MTLEDVVNGAISPFDDYCDGYGNPGASGMGYISVLKLSTGMVARQMDTVLEAVVAHDRAEKNDAYAGQVNMRNTSSFNGINGAVWGYDLARHDGLTDGSIRPIMRRRRHDGADLPIFPVAPLLDAGRQLFGTEAARRYPLLPGSHVVGATKSITVRGPTSVWSLMALAVAQDRESDSSLFVEDVGRDLPAATPADREALLETRMEDIVDSIMLCGADQHVKYKEIFIGFKTRWIPDGYIGSALTCAPYLVLARNAVPDPVTELLGMSLSEWEYRHGF